MLREALHIVHSGIVSPEVVRGRRPSLGRHYAIRGVVGLTHTLALETARSHEPCKTICPGRVSTPQVQQQIAKRIAEGSDPEQAHATAGRKAALRRVCHPGQQGELALFHGSKSDAQMCSAVWNMDGGWVAQ